MGDPVADYRAAVIACHKARALLHEHDLPSLLAAFGRAETTGPVLDPTLWREKAKLMEQDKEILRAALVLWKFTLNP
jgi:hypothetical protein